jgi:hypothetical protein
MNQKGVMLWAFLLLIVSIWLGHSFRIGRTRAVCLRRSLTLLATGDSGGEGDESRKPMYSESEWDEAKKSKKPMYSESKWDEAKKSRKPMYSEDDLKLKGSPAFEVLVPKGVNLSLTPAEQKMIEMKEAAERAAAEAMAMAAAETGEVVEVEKMSDTDILKAEMAAMLERMRNS